MQPANYSMQAIYLEPSSMLSQLNKHDDSCLTESLYQ